MQNQVKKFDMAVEQLEDALRTYFDGRYHSAIVLAGAAEQHLQAYMKLHELTSSWSQTREAATQIANGLKARAGKSGKPTTVDDIGKLMNRGYNSSKHAGLNNLSIDMDPREEANHVIDRAICNYDSLSGHPDYADSVLDIELSQRFIRESLQSLKLGPPPVD